jgi:hypothetical protein
VFTAASRSGPIGRSPARHRRVLDGEKIDEGRGDNGLATAAWVRRRVMSATTGHASSVEGVVAAAIHGVPALELVERANGQEPILRAALAAVSSVENSDAMRRLERALAWIRPTAGTLR